MNKKFLTGLFVLCLSALACEPVIAIGWREILIVFILAAIVMGPPIYRFIRKVEKIWRAEKKDQN